MTKEIDARSPDPASLGGELAEGYVDGLSSTVAAEEHSLKDFYRFDSPDLLKKCDRFFEMVKDSQKKGFYQSQYRVTLTSGLGNRIVVFNPFARREETMICFDSNSYLGLHLHPEVVARVKAVTDEVGYGTPSAQLLGGTNKYLRELEETISSFYDREDTIIFPTGYSANLGTIQALIREKDLVVRDRFSHASIHDGVRASESRLKKTYRHNDMDHLEEILSEHSSSAAGKLIITDGVFSMHGGVARLDELRRIADRHSAKLMVDEAHALGVIGPGGRGTEERYDAQGAADILMGTFSKTPGAVGGYVTGSSELVYYLRFFARPAMFTASLPAAICAGVTAAFRLLEEEPWHREKLWENVRYLHAALVDMGYNVPEPESAILTAFIGRTDLLWLFSRDLFTAGIKCGNVTYPAVPQNEGIIRITLNAMHTTEDLDQTLDVFKKLGRKYQILGRSFEELKQLDPGKLMHRSG